MARIVCLTVQRGSLVNYRIHNGTLIEARVESVHTCRALPFAWVRPVEADLAHLLIRVPLSALRLGGAS